MLAELTLRLLLPRAVNIKRKAFAFFFGGLHVALIGLLRSIRDGIPFWELAETVQFEKCLGRTKGEKQDRHKLLATAAYSALPHVLIEGNCVGAEGTFG